jgi:hypothetical protein
MRVLNCDFDDISNNYYFSQMFSPSPFVWKIAIRTAQRRLISKVQKPVEVLPKT